jgi:hypothetical protein
MKIRKPLTATSFNALSVEEKERIFQECEKITPPMGRALNATELRQFEAFRHAAKAARGRPRVGLGAERINVTVEKSLLKQTDNLAKKQKISRSEAIARALREWLAGAA